MREAYMYRGAVFEDELRITHDENRCLGLALVTKHKEMTRDFWEEIKENNGQTS